MAAIGVLPAEPLLKIIRCVDEPDENTADASPVRIGELALPLRSVVQLKALLSATLVCRRWRSPAQRVLFQRIKSGNRRSLDRLDRIFAVLASRPELANAVETLLVNVDNDPSASAVLSSLLALLPNLRAYLLKIHHYLPDGDEGLEPGFLPGLINQKLIYLGIYGAGSSSASWNCSGDDGSRCYFPFSLQRLDVQNTTMPGTTMPKLPNVTTLCLDSKNVGAVPAGAFAAFPSLKVFYIEVPQFDGEFKSLGEVTHMVFNVDDYTSRPSPSDFPHLVHLQINDSCSLGSDDIDWLPEQLEQIVWILNTGHLQHHEDWIYDGIHKFLENLCAPTYLVNLASIPEIYLDEYSSREAMVNVLTLELAQEAMEAISKRNLPFSRDGPGPSAAKKKQMFRIFPPRWVAVDS